MTRTLVLLGLSSVLAAAGGCAGPGSTACGDGVDALTAVLTGSFSSAAQAEVDPDNYFDIRLRAAEIWTDRDDGPWLYVEQAAGTALDRPYRQRVYQLSARLDDDATRYISSVYTMPEPLTYAGWWRTPERFDGGLAPEELSLREGCSIVMTLDDGVFSGATVGNGCASSLGGASYATSEVVLTLDRLETWDRGFDAGGVQVWGATGGPYLFDRIE